MNLPEKSNILIIAPHPDDEVLGLGGAIKKFSDMGHAVSVLLVSGHLPPLYKEEVFPADILFDFLQQSGFLSCQHHKH